MAELERARAAGFFNGEGSFYLSRHRRSDGTYHIQPRISITQSGLDKPEDLIQFAEATGNTGVYYGPYRYRGGNPRWQYRVAGYDRVREIFQSLLPWLSDIKKFKAKTILQQYLDQEWRLTNGKPYAKIVEIK